MNVCVLGLWHLGCVNAAGLASVGHRVVGLELDVVALPTLQAGKAPLFEPGLDALMQQGLAGGQLRFTSDVVDAVAGIAILLVAYDTPVDENDVADTDYVMERVTQVMSKLPKHTVVLVSSQLPVGSVQRLEQRAAKLCPELELEFACSPENLRLGKALDVFLRPDRVVVGVRNAATKAKLQDLLSPLTGSLEWMGVESAEMTKHAINAFLATSVTFANELASLCELVGADGREVARGLKTDARIGPKAYLAPGGAFAGGTLARDVVFLGEKARAQQLSTPLLSAITPSNDAHKLWAQRCLQRLFPTLGTVVVMVWGLTYKPGTSTLRRSTSVDMCDWLLRQGVQLHVHDPMVKQMPAEWAGRVRRHDDPVNGARGVQVLVVATEWPEYRDVSASQIAQANPGLVVVDANRFVGQFASQTGVRYVSVGTAEVSV